MSLVVSDTSPLRALSHLDLLGPMEALFPAVLVPPAVADELVAGAPSCPPVHISPFPFIRVVVPHHVSAVSSAHPDLDLGEVEAIALALEFQADELLIDERLGRRVAVEYGLAAVGALGVLLRMKDQGVVTEVAPLMVLLRDEARFFISDALFHQVRQAANEPG